MAWFSKSSKSFLAIDAAQNCLFVTPPNTPNSLPEEELILRGTLRLVLHKPRRLESISVRLENRAILHAPVLGFHLDEILLDRQVFLQEASADFDAGTHHFTFEFPVPATSPPWERTVYGGIKMCLFASVRGERNLDARLPVFWFVSPTVGELANTLDFEHTGFEERLGMYTIEMLSPSVTPAAIIRSYISLHAPPEDVYIRSMTWRCTQTFTLQSLKDKDRKAEPEPMILNYATIDRSNVREALEVDGQGHIHFNVPIPGNNFKAAFKIDAGHRSAFIVKTRLPNDAVLRPSTHPGTITPMQMEHGLSLKIVYFVGNTGQAHAFTIRQPLTVSSCTQMTENIIVPPYTEEDDTTPDMPEDSHALRLWLEDRDHVCTIPLSELLEQSQKWAPPHAVRRARSNSVALPPKPDN